MHHQNVSYVAILEGAAPSASQTYSLSPGQFEKHSPRPDQTGPPIWAMSKDALLALNLNTFAYYIPTYILLLLLLELLPSLLALCSGCSMKPKILLDIVKEMVIFCNQSSHFLAAAASAASSMFYYFHGLLAGAPACWVQNFT